MMRRLSYIAVLLCLLISPWSAPRSEIYIKSLQIDVEDDVNFQRQMQELLPFNPSEPTTEEQIVTTLQELKELGLFKTYDYHLTRIGSKNYKLSVFLQPGKRIRGLGVRGNYPILGKDITRLIPLQPGTIYDEGLLQESIDQITSYLRKLGYYDSKVRIKVKHIKKYDVFDLVIRIKKGKTYRVEDINVTGNSVISTKRIKTVFRHWSRFSEKQLKLDIKRLKNLYSKKGYIKARVKVTKMEFDDEKKKINLNISIRENKRLKIVFTGDSIIGPHRLRLVTQLKERRSYDRYAIRLARTRIERYFQKSGYPNVNVTSEILKPEADLVIAKFNISSGKRIEVKKIKIEGNKEVGDKKIKSEIDAQQTELFSRAWFNRKKIVQNHIDMYRFYKDQGFFDVNIDEPSMENNKFGDLKTVTFPITEGQRYKFGKIEVQSDKPVQKEDLVKNIKIKPGKEYEFIKVAETKNTILDNLHEQGFAYATVEPLIEINHDKNVVDLTYQILRGKKVYINSIRVDGNLKTKSKNILRNLKIREGEAFSYQKMLDAQLNIRKMGLFSSVRISPIGFDQKKTKLDLLVTVTERKTVITNVQAGVDSRNFFTGEFNFTKLNLFGGARQLNMRLIGGKRYSRGELTFYSPRIFGASWNLSNQYFGQFEDLTNYDAISYGGFINTLKNFGNHFTFGFKEQITRTDLDEANSNVAALGNALFDNTFNELQLSAIIDYRDNYSDPKRGIYVLVRNELNTDLSDIKNNFNTFEFNISQYNGFLKRFNFVNTVRFGYTFKISNNPRIPANKLFFLGGADTVRGFTEDGIDPSGGTVSLIYNGELQFALMDSVKIAGFFDAGLLQDNLNNISTNNFRESAGVGLRYFTPIGPLRLDWGFILDRQGNEPKSRIHFSFGYFF